MSKMMFVFPLSFTREGDEDVLSDVDEEDEEELVVPIGARGNKDEVVVVMVEDLVAVANLGTEDEILVRCREVVVLAKRSSGGLSAVGGSGVSRFGRRPAWPGLGGSSGEGGGFDGGGRIMTGLRGCNERRTTRLEDCSKGEGGALRETKLNGSERVNVPVCVKSVGDVLA